MKAFKRSLKTGYWLAFVIIIAQSLFFTACDKNENDDEDTYYVKYEIDIVAPQNAESNVTVATEEKVNQGFYFKGSKHKELICGPFKKGFVAGIVGSDLLETTYHSFKISISKNGGPFVQKAYGSDDLIEYNI